MSFIPVLQYCFGLGVFGFVYWLLEGIRELIVDLGISETGSAFDLIMLLWAGVLIVYLIFGGIWVIRKYNEAEYREGY